MPDPEDPPPSSGPARPLDPRLAKQDWTLLLAQLARFAARHTRGDAELAYDVASTAILRTLDPKTSAYDHDKHPDLLFYLGSVVNGLLANHYKRAATHREKQGVKEHVVARVAAPTPTAEHVMTEAEEEEETEERAQQYVAALLALLEGDDLAKRLVELTMQGIDKPADQAARTGRPIEDIRNARKRLARARDAVLEAERKKKGEG